MTEKEAIAAIIYHMEFCKQLEKQITKKPKKHGCRGWYFCPDCLRLIKKRIEDSSYDIKFCPFCGQALDWNEKE